MEVGKQAYLKHLEAQPWYGELVAALTLGVCHVPNEQFPLIMDALDHLGKASKAGPGETDDYTCISCEIDTEDSSGKDANGYPAADSNGSAKDKRVAEEILRQLGGNEFVTMTGSRNFIADGNTLWMCLAKNASGANRLFITYHRHPDTYDMRFFYYWAPHIRRVAELGKVAAVPEVQRDVEVFRDIYCDMLRVIFEQVTGFETHMPRILQLSNTFEYGGRRFSPLRSFKKGEVDRQAPNDSRPWKRDAHFAMRNMRTDRDLHLTVPYLHEQFYKASGGSNCDIFRCAENGRLYVPCANELCLYDEPKK